VEAAVVFTLVTAGVVAFQLALALGAPWGDYAMGGTFPGKYPPLMRVAAAVQAGLLILLALIVLSRAGLVLLSQWIERSTWLIWLVVAFSAVALVLNLVTSSSRERRIWAPVAAVLLVCSLTVALAGK
jgi:hypothetical protein